MDHENVTPMRKGEFAAPYTQALRHFCTETTQKLVHPDYFDCQYLATDQWKPVRYRDVLSPLLCRYSASTTALCTASPFLSKTKSTSCFMITDVAFVQV